MCPQFSTYGNGTCYCLDRWATSPHQHIRQPVTSRVQSCHLPHYAVARLQSWATDPSAPQLLRPEASRGSAPRCRLHPSAPRQSPLPPDPQLQELPTWQGPRPPPGLPVPPLWQPMGQVAGVPIIGGMAALQPATGASGPPAADLVKAEPHAAGRPGLAAPDATFVDASADPAPRQRPESAAAHEWCRQPSVAPLGFAGREPGGDQIGGSAATPLRECYRNQQSAASGDGRAAALRDVEKAAATLATSEAAAIAAAAESQVLSGL